MTNNSSCKISPRWVFVLSFFFCTAVSISKKVIITSPFEDQKVADDSTAIISCQAVGNPLPRVTIEVINDIATLNMDFTTIPNGKLLRLQCRECKEKIQVQCKANNGDTMDTKSATIRFIKHENNLPRLIEEGKTTHIDAKLGETVSLMCKLQEGLALKRIEWFKGKIPLTIGSYWIAQDPQNLTISLKSIQESDDGEYECYVTNDAGSSLSNVKFVRVGGEPAEIKFKYVTKSLNVLAGEEITLECVIESNPFAEVEWISPRGSTMAKSDNFSVSIKLTNVNQDYAYTCKASNQFTSKERKVKISAMPRPRAPIRVNVHRITATSAWIEWSEDKNYSNDKLVSRTSTYSLTYSTPEKSETVRGIKKNSYLLENLTPATAYEFYITAFDSNQNPSPKSQNISFTSNEAAPGSPPTNITAEVTSSNTVVLSWNEPLKKNGKITRYEVQYARLPDNFHGISTTKGIIWNTERGSEPNLKRRSIIKSLRKDASYQFRVSAETASGVGPYSAPITVKVNTNVPPPPDKFTYDDLTSRQVSLVWSISDRKNEIDKLLLRYKKNSSDTPVEIKIDKTRDSFLVDNLEPDSVYFFSLAAIANQGLGVAAQFHVKTLQVGQTEPRNISNGPLKRDEGQDYWTIVQWLPPNQIKGSIKNYLVEIRKKISPDPDNDYDMFKTLRKHFTGTSFNTSDIRPLKPGSTYEIDIRANDDSGLLASGLHLIRVPESAPTGPPNPIRLTYVTEKSLGLSWDPPEVDKMGGKIIKYEVKYSEKVKEEEANTKSTLTQVNAIELKDLKHPQKYFVSIRAYTKLGPGPWSQKMTFETQKNNISAPIEINAKWINSGQIKVSWHSPRQIDSNQPAVSSAITGFQISYAPSSNPTEVKKIEVGPVYMTTIDGLENYNGNSFIIKIRSKSNKGLLGQESEGVLVPQRSSNGYLQRYNSNGYSDNLICKIDDQINNGSSIKTFLTIEWKNPMNIVEEQRLNYSGNRFYLNEDAQPIEHHVNAQVVTLKSDHQKFTFEAEPNTMYDVNLMLKVNGNDQIQTKTTSCTSAMRPPINIPFPKFGLYDKSNSQIVATVERVSEIWGKIQIYFLIVAKPDAIENEISNLRPVNNTYLLVTKQAEILAEYDQSSFRDSRLEIPIQVKKDSLNRKRRDIEDYSSYLNGGATLHNVQLVKDHVYRSAIMACIHDPDEARFNQRMSNKKSDYCSFSEWSPPFKVAELADIRQPTSDVFTEKKSLNTFTITVASVILTILFVSLVFCIGCFLKQRPSKKNNKMDSCEKINNTLKVPLIQTNNGVQQHPKNRPTNPMPNSENRTNVQPQQHILQNRLDSQTLANHQAISKLQMERHEKGEIHPMQVEESRQQSIIERTAIPFDHLARHVIALKANNNLGISQEFSEIQVEGNYSWHEATKEMNKLKNRYANVIAYDHSRVVLKVNNSANESDYINANYIDGYKKKNFYIATQGPLNNTFGDFWRMVWEQNSRIIVMMTGLQERSRIKCDQYWPSRGQATYPVYSTFKSSDDSLQAKIITAYQVTIQETVQHSYCICRIFKLQRLDLREGILNDPDGNFVPNSDCREIRHYQFTAWPDYGAPIQSQPLLLFIRKVNQGRINLMMKAMPENSRAAISNRYSRSNSSGNFEMGPTVVHCSAGVGRTGAFIVIDSQLERLHAEKTVDVFGTVCKMRLQRNFMVQTEEQYIFLYDVLVEAVEVTNTEVPIDSLMNYVIRLRQPASTVMLKAYADSMNSAALVHQKCSYLELEFKRLSLNLRAKDKFVTAQLPENQSKNRFANLIPYEENRVKLEPIRGSSDYINASYIDGYWRQKSYIATQTPMSNTVEDFWRMIWEQNSPIVVMLSKSTQNRDAVGHVQQYWPTERIIKFPNGISVEPIVEYNMQSFVLREFRLSDGRDGQSRTLRQFQFTGWPDSDVAPKSAESLIDLIGQVHKTQAQFGQDGPITVHCSNGVGLTGVFLALSLVLDRLRAEGVIDLFLTCRLLRTQRMQLVQTFDHYTFCYSATQDYCSQFSKDTIKHSQRYL